MDISKIITFLKEQKNNKYQASLLLGETLNIKPELIFYEYCKRNIPQKGEINTGGTFFFHGQDCHVKTHNLDVEIEFGPDGEVKGFDKWHLSYLLNIPYNETDHFISMLENSNIICLINAQLYRLSQEPDKNELINNMSLEKQIDISVADRYILMDLE